MDNEAPSPTEIADGLITLFEEHDMDALDCLIFIKDLEDELAILRAEIEEEIAFG